MSVNLTRVFANGWKRSTWKEGMLWHPDLRVPTVSGKGVFWLFTPEQVEKIEDAPSQDARDLALWHTILPELTKLCGMGRPYWEREECR